MSVYQHRINQKILEFYKKFGLENTKKFCMKLLVSDKHKDDKTFYAHTHGEICESVLECCIIDFIKRNKLGDKWFYKKGLVLLDLENPNSGYSTEVDFMLFTHNKIISIECKSYKGDKIIEKECTIRRKNNVTDVYDQHIKHDKVIVKLFDSFRETSIKTVNIDFTQMALFDFSLGTLKDTRTDYWKIKMPALNISNIDRFLNTFLNKESFWDMNYLRRATSVIERHNNKRKKKHISYVSGLHGSA